MSCLSTLPAGDAARLVKLAGMMASAHDGEALNAARAATKLLGNHGLTWSDALSPAPARTADRWGVPRPATPDAPWRRQVMACRSAPNLFTAWEREFLNGLGTIARISPKQGEILDRLHAKADQHFREGKEAA